MSRPPPGTPRPPPTSAPPTPQKAARVAALQAGDSYRRAAEAAIHLFGDIGFTQEHDAQLYYRRAWSAERLAGGPQAHRDALAPGYRVSMWP